MRLSRRLAPLLLAAAFLPGWAPADLAAQTGLPSCAFACDPPAPRRTTDFPQLPLPASRDAPSPPLVDPTPAQPTAFRGTSGATGVGRLPPPAARIPVLLQSGAIPGPLSETDAGWLRDAFSAARKGQWDRALDLAASAESTVPGIVTRGLWLADPESNASFFATLDFLESYPDWPLGNTLRTRLEERIGDHVSDEWILHAFDRDDPRTGRGWLYLALALARGGSPERALAAARVAWREHGLDAREERALLDAFGPRLDGQAHLLRLEDRIWNRDWEDAVRQLPRVPERWRRLGEARIALGRRLPGVDRAISRVPSELRDDPGLIFERARWRRRSGLQEAARDLLTRLPEPLPEAERWWEEINLHVRNRLRARDFDEAYRMASLYRSFEGEPRRQGAWLAGWIALEFLRLPPVVALEHLAAARAASLHPADVALAAYWQSRAAERAGRFDLATAYAEDAALREETFFGQLALRRLGRSLRLPGPPELADADRDAVQRKFYAQLVLALGQADGGAYAWPFLSALLRDARGGREAASVVALAYRSGMPGHAARAARRSVAAGHRHEGLLFPIPPDAAFPRDAVDAGVQLPVALAVANQESGFDRRASSHAGALGLMQVRPGTAREVARRLGLPYGRDRLQDPGYNVRLGTAYLRAQTELYAGSLPLALAAYNAGSANVDRWLRLHGDPRGDEERLVNWILLIPYEETRDYVQRVLERISAYEFLLTPEGEATAPLRHLAF